MMRPTFLRKPPGGYQGVNKNIQKPNENQEQNPTNPNPQEINIENPVQVNQEQIHKEQDQGIKDNNINNNIVNSAEEKANKKVKNIFLTNFFRKLNAEIGPFVKTNLVNMNIPQKLYFKNFLIYIYFFSVNISQNVNLEQNACIFIQISHVNMDFTVQD